MSASNTHVTLKGVDAIYFNAKKDKEAGELIALVHCLEEKINAILQRIQQLETHLYYMPGSEGEKESKEEFINAMSLQQSKNYTHNSQKSHGKVGKNGPESTPSSS